MCVSVCVRVRLVLHERSPSILRQGRCSVALVVLRRAIYPPAQQQQRRRQQQDTPNLAGQELVWDGFECWGNTGERSMTTDY
jgi:hypothetical protein